MADESNQYVNAVVSGSRLTAYRRLPDGRLASKGFTAEYSCFLKREDFARIEKWIRASRSIIAPREEGDFVRILFRDQDSRYALCKPNGWFASQGIQSYEGDLHPVRRWLIDQRPLIQRPRVALFDIETDSRVSFAHKEEMRILCWAMWVGGELVADTLADDSDRAERDLLENFWSELEGADQALAWSGDRFDFEVIRKRSERYRIRVDLRRWLWLDHMECFRKYNMHSTESGEEKDSVALERVSASLGFDTTDKTAVDASQSWELWSAGGESRASLLRRCCADVLLMRKIEERTGYVDLHYTVCSMTGCFPESRAIAALVHVEAFVMRLAAERGIRFPTTWGQSKQQRIKFAGAVVFPVKPGIKRDVHVCDFAGMYPSIIETLNISPETYCPELSGRPGETLESVRARLPDGYAVAPYTLCVFRQEPRGILPITVSETRQIRKTFKRRKEEAEPGTKEWLDADRGDQGGKIVNNSEFGVASSPFSRLYMREVGESITLTGKWLIEQTVSYGQATRGFEVLAGDSITGDRIVVVKDPSGHVRMLPVVELWEKVAVDSVKVRGGKEVSFVSGWRALARDDTGYEGWFPLREVIRHRAGKPLWLVTTKYGQTRVTSDHGIMVGGKAVRPEDFAREKMVFERVEPTTPEPKEVVDILDHVREFDLSTELRGKPVTRRFEVSDDGQTLFLGSGEKGSDRIRVQRFYQKGSEEFHALLRLVGAYVADGSASIQGLTSCRHMLSFCKSDLNLQKRILADLKLVTREADFFGPFWTETVYVVRSGTATLTCFFAALCGNKSREKRLPSFAFDLVPEDRRVLVSAMWDGDGYRGPNGELEYTSNSAKLTSGLSYVLAQDGLLHSFVYRASKKSWQIKILKSQMHSNAYSVMTAVDQEPDGYVYDLSVEGAHTFVDGIGRVLLHNTDSCFVTGISEDRFRAFVTECNRDLYPRLVMSTGATRNSIELEYEKEFGLLVQVAVKKRYAGRLKHFKGKRAGVDARPVIKGFEYKRGDSTRMTRRFQEEVVRRLLLVGQEVPRDYPLGPDDFVEVIERWRDETTDGDLTRRDVTIPQSLRKELAEYDRGLKKDGTPVAMVQHARIATVLAERGEDVSEGTRIEYIVTDGDASPLGVIPAKDYRLGCEDRHYLWEVKVWPPVRRILVACSPDYPWSRYDETKDREGGEDSRVSESDSTTSRGSSGHDPTMKKRSEASASRRNEAVVTKETGVTEISEELFPDEGSTRESGRPDSLRPPPQGDRPPSKGSGVPTIDDLTMGAGFDRIVRTLFDVEASSDEYDRLRKRLSFQQSVTAMTYGQIVDALDVAQDSAMRARELLALARVTLTNYEITCKQILATYRERAIADLQAQKDAGKFSKAIQNDDVEAVMARSYPKEWHAIASKLKESEEFVKVLSALEERWTDRAKNLQQMVARTRAVD